MSTISITYKKAGMAHALHAEAVENMLVGSNFHRMDVHSVNNE
jgi:hypothetical protein